jgi:hypothetical protein
MPKKGSWAMCTIRVWEQPESGRLEKARVAVSHLKGIVKSEADYISQMLTVEYDPARTTLATIQDAVRRTGRN